MAVRPAYAASYKIQEIAGLCPSFIVAVLPDSEGHEDPVYLDGTAIIFAHFSVREYLLTRCYYEYNTANGHAYLAMHCMRYFNDRKTYKEVKSSFALGTISSISMPRAGGWIT